MRTAVHSDAGKVSYHLVSRVVDRCMVLGPKDKETFRRILSNQEAFSRMKVVTCGPTGRSLARRPFGLP